MSTESTRNFTDVATNPAAREIAASAGKRAASRATVDIRYLGADEADARGVEKSTTTEAHPYSSFERGGVRRFDRTPFARGPFYGGSDLPPFRIS